MGPIEFGNTTVRSALRLRDGLIAIANSGKQGRLRGREGDLALIELLAEAGVIDERGDDTYSVGRKWRAALCKLGFLYDKYDAIAGQIGNIDEITPSGYRLLEASSLAAQQECFLRSVAALQLAYNGRSYRVGPGFSPFKHIARVLIEVEKRFQSSNVTFAEFASFCQFSPAVEGPATIVDRITKHRHGRTNAANKKQYDVNALKDSHARNGRVALSSYVDYADENIRYLKATGCFSAVGRGIGIFAAKHQLVTTLIDSIPEDSTHSVYWKNATEGLNLPTDNLEFAIDSLNQLEANANARGIKIRAHRARHEVREINNLRYDLEEALALDAEREFALRQRGEAREIEKYLATLLPKKHRNDSISQTEEIEIPRGEAPAYLEWAVWRAFLAINSIENPPFESRRFRVDRDFLPVTHAPGNGPDLVFEFAGFTLVVEVTLLTSDRQATAEQVGVRRHVYEIAAARRPKPVYCLFLAPSIRNETARDFKTAGYEADDGSHLELTVIPLEIATFMDFFSELVNRQITDPDVIRSSIEKCASAAKTAQSTIEWMRTIDSIFRSSIALIGN